MIIQPKPPGIISHFCRDGVEPLTAFFTFIRANRKSILSQNKPLPFCLSLTDGIANIAPLERALAILSPLSGDLREYAISSAYALLIAPEERKRLCAYFTPPSLAAAAMEAANCFIESVEHPTILDPACGGGSFLAPAARRLAAAQVARGIPPERAARLALERIHGIELDPNLAAISRKLLANALERDYGFRPSHFAAITLGDTLTCDIPRQYDIVIGNPPFGRVYGRASTEALARAGRANLHGHTNLYSLFLLWALDAVKPNGGLVFVLPTSFVAGPYFAGLRQEILERADVLRIDLHEDREHLFVGAIQDVCLLTLRRHGTKDLQRPVSWYDLGIINAAGTLRSIGSAPAAPGGEPWTLPVPGRLVSSLTAQARIQNRKAEYYVIADYGYRIRVGKVVPTRERQRLRQLRNRTSLPLIWASDIRPDGSFLFASGRRRGNEPWYDPPSAPTSYLTCRPTVALQRTSNRDQRRRLNAAAISPEFLYAHRTRGFVAENHVILIEATTAKPLVPARKMAALLNSEPVNQRFATVAGSFSVSAQLLARLAMPDPKELPDMKCRNFSVLLAAVFASIEAVLSPLETSRDAQHCIDQLRDTGGDGALKQDPGFKRRAVA